MGRALRAEGENRKGRILTEADLARREKNHNKKSALVARQTKRSNFGFNDDPVEKECSNCGEMVIDVYPFRVELPELRTRISGYPVMDICPRCFNDFAKRGVKLVTVESDDGLIKRESGQIYDPSKPRVKLF